MAGKAIIRELTLKRTKCARYEFVFVSALMSEATSSPRDTGDTSRIIRFPFFLVSTTRERDVILENRTHHAGSY